MEDFLYTLLFCSDSSIFNNGRSSSRLGNTLYFPGHKYFVVSSIKKALGVCSFFSFSSFIESFMSNYTTFEAKRHKNSIYATYSCSNSSKKIIEDLSGQSARVSIYTPHKFEGKVYPIAQHEIGESIKLENSQYSTLRRSARHVLVLTIDEKTFYNHLYNFFQNFEHRDSDIFFEYLRQQKKVFTLLVDKDFTEREDSKSLYRRICKHYYQTEEAKKSINIKLVNKEYIYKNALSEMIYTSLSPQRSQEIIEEIA